MKNTICSFNFVRVLVIALLLGLLPGSAFAATPMTAQVVVPIPGPALDVYQVTVNDGAGGQLDPHVSGDWVSYTDASVDGIRFQNLDLGAASDRLIPRTDGIYDMLSDISGDTIVFTRYTVVSIGSGGLVTYSESIDLSQIDPFGNPGSAIEVSPVDGVLPLRGHPAIGGDTIAYMDRTYNGSSDTPAEISLSNAADPAAPAIRLTNDTLDDKFPAVSPDGNAVVWLKCAYNANPSACDVWRTERTGGVWGTPEQVTGADGSESFPHTNGPVTVYGSTAGGDNNIRWSVKDSSGAYIESVLDLPGPQRNPNISGNLIAFESSPELGQLYDSWLYDLATNRLYRLTDTPSVNEMLTDVTTGPSGLVRVAWMQDKQVYPYDLDVYAMSLLVDNTPPVITPEIQGTLGQNGWYTSDVTLSWLVSDAQSEFTSSGCDPVIITSDQAATQYTCSAESAGGANSASVTIARDATPPSLDPVVTPNPVSWNASATANSNAADALSGIASTGCEHVDTSSVGAHTVSCTAADNAGNTWSQSASYEVVSLFPTSAVLDDFNRGNGKVGGNWTISNSLLAYRIAGQRLDVELGGALIWKPTSFGVSQEAFLTFSALDKNSPTQGLILKAQSSSRTEGGVIVIVYDALAKAVRVSALRLNGRNWTIYGNIPAVFADGDQFGGRALANGNVEIYQNGALIATVTLNAQDQAFFNNRGGRIGIWTLAARHAFLDDFGGGNAAP